MTMPDNATKQCWSAERVTRCEPSYLNPYCEHPQPKRLATYTDSGNDDTADSREWIVEHQHPEVAGDELALVQLDEALAIQPAALATGEILGRVIHVSCWCKG